VARLVALVARAVNTSDGGLASLGPADALRFRRTVVVESSARARRCLRARGASVAFAGGEFANSERKSAAAALFRSGRLG
jgi:hypothetical protein